MEKLVLIFILLFVFYGFFRYNRKHGNAIRQRRNAILDRLSQPPKKN